MYKYLVHFFISEFKLPSSSELRLQINFLKMKARAFVQTWITST